PAGPDVWCPTGRIGCARSQPSWRARLAEIRPGAAPSRTRRRGARHASPADRVTKGRRGYRENHRTKGRTTMHRHITTMTIGAVLLSAAVYAAFLLRVTLNRTAGEDPSVSAACLSVGDARWDGVLARISLNNMDPARFPAGAACQTEARIGGVTRTGI